MSKSIPAKSVVGDLIAVLGLLVAIITLGVAILQTVLTFPSTFKDGYESIAIVADLCQRYGACVAEPMPPLPQLPSPPRVARPTAAVVPPCANDQSIAVKVIDLRDGTHLPMVAAALTRSFSRDRLTVTSWPFDGNLDPMSDRDEAALQIPGLPSVLVLGLLKARDRSVIRDRGRHEVFEIDGTLELRVLSGPCGRRRLKNYVVIATGVGDHYPPALASLGEEVARELKRQLAVSGF